MNQLPHSGPAAGWPWSTRRSPRPGRRVPGHGPGELGDRDLQGQRVDVDVGGRVHAGHAVHEAGGGAAGVVTREAAKVAQVEDCAQVDVEAFGSLPANTWAEKGPAPTRVDGGAARAA